jgi:hypothetical protein
MKVTKSSIHRITADTGCGCKVMREYEDIDFKKPIGESGTFSPCEKHTGVAGVDVIEMVLSELVDKEAEDHKSTPAPNAPRPNAAATVNAEGQLEMRTPVKANTTVGKVKIQSSGSSPRPGVPARTMQTGRSGPVKFQRPTQSTPRVPNTAALNTALPEAEEDDLLAANDPTDFS